MGIMPFIQSYFEISKSEKYWTKPSSKTVKYSNTKGKISELSCITDDEGRLN